MSQHRQHRFEHNGCTIEYDDLMPVEEDRCGEPMGPFRWHVRGRKGHDIGSATTSGEAMALADAAYAPR